MQLSDRAVQLRAALESAADAPAEVTEIGPTRIRIAAPIRARLPHRQYQDALTAVQQGDDWGTSGITGTVTVWAEVSQPGRTAP
ncbi:hypothetical protein [Streptacidiphilus sp. PAMC 29251]